MIKIAIEDLSPLKKIIKNEKKKIARTNFLKFMKFSLIKSSLKYIVNDINKGYSLAIYDPAICSQKNTCILRLNIKISVIDVDKF